MRSTRKLHRAVGVAVTTCVLLVGFLAGTASADPQKGDALTLSCEGGIEIDAIVFSNGQWSPALDTASNAVFHPVEFRDQSFEVSDSDGNVLFQDNPPDIAKNGYRLGQDLIECAYSSSFEAFDPDVGEIFGTASGSVVVFVAS